MAKGLSVNLSGSQLPGGRRRQDRPTIGKTISHYKIIEKLGEGGMGVVYKSEDAELQRTVALEFLSAQALESDEERERLIHEARAAASIDHANVCTVYEIGKAEGRTFIAMGYYYWGLQEYDKALREFAAAKKVRPNDSRIIEAEGYILRRKSKFNEAFDRLKLALLLSPRDPDLPFEIGMTCNAVRRYAEARDY